jgi:hypothetical protein
MPTIKKKPVDQPMCYEVQRMTADTKKKDTLRFHNQAAAITYITGAPFMTGVFRIARVVDDESIDSITVTAAELKKSEKDMLKYRTGGEKRKK